MRTSNRGVSRATTMCLYVPHSSLLSHHHMIFPIFPTFLPYTPNSYTKFSSPPHHKFPMVLRNIQNIPSEHLYLPTGPDSGSTAIRHPTMTSGGTGAAHNIPAPPNRPASPSGSLYAMSDDEEGEYNTITHQESGKGVKLLFSKSKVRHELPYYKCHFGVKNNSELTIYTGLHPPHTFFQRQHPRLHSPPPAEAADCWTTHLVRFIRSSLHSLLRPLTGMDSRNSTRRSRQCLCES